MGNSYLEKLIVFTQAFLIFASYFIFLVPNTKAQESLLPLPSQRYGYSYDQATTTITEYIDLNASGRKFINPAGLTAELWKQGLPGAYTGTYVGDGGDTPSDEGMIAFQLDGHPDYYLIVRFKTQQTMGLYKKSGTTDKYFYSWVYTSFDNGKKSIHIMKPGGTGQFDIDTSASESLVNYVASVNGTYISTNGIVILIKEAGRGTGIEVNNLITSTLTTGTKICGKTTIDFSSSTMWDKLSDNDKTLAPKTTVQWPKDFLVAGASRSLDVPLYIQYKVGNTYVNASYGNVPKGYINIKNDASGSWEIDMTGMPTGTYKLNPEFFLRWANDDRTLVRPDTPTQGWYSDWVASVGKKEDDIEIFTSPAYEVTVENGNWSDLKAKDCSLTLAMVSRGSWDAGRLNATGKDVCATEGNGIIAMLQEAFCGLVVIIKNGADTVFNWAKYWMELSIGVVRNKSKDIQDNLDMFNLKDESGSTGTGTGTSGSSSSSSTASPGGTTSPDESAIQFRVLANITIANRDNFEKLARAVTTDRISKPNENPSAVWIKIGPIDQSNNWVSDSSDIFYGKAEYFMWDTDNKTVKVKFTATQSLPSIYSRIGILGGIGENTYLFTISVPQNQVNKTYLDLWPTYPSN